MAHGSGLHAEGTPTLFERSAQYGWLGVDLFFVLSGFLITGVLLKARQDRKYYQNFYARRALRIFPVYYLAVVGALVIVPALHLGQGRASQGGYPWTVQIWFWLNLSNLLTAFHPLIVMPLTHFWSLAIEEQFYLVWPGCLRTFTTRGLIWLTAGLLIAGEVARNLPIVDRTAAQYPDFIYRLTPLHMDGLLCGALLALLLSNRNGAKPKNWTAAYMCLGGSILTSVLILAWLAKAAVWSLFIQRWAYLAAGLFFSSVVGLILDGGPSFWLSRLFSLRALRWVGALSYCLYVIHLTGLHLGEIVARHVPGLGAAGQVRATPPLALFICLVISICSRIFVESPALRLKRYFRYNASVGRQDSLAVQ
jgi:peptidoglycan/LPS O-acetylase OafA/YrhL